jgi:hypothetical protein
MSEMIERAASAMAELGVKATWEDLAQAAISAMREPTLEMIAAAWHCDGTGDIWKAMIDEALKDRNRVENLR